MSSVHRSAPAVVLVLAILAGCAKDDVEEARERMRESGGNPPAGQAADPHAGMANPHGGGMASPHGGGMGATGGPSDGNEIPLKTTGNGSAAELERELAKLQDPQVAAHFERAFRLTFSSDPQKRDYQEAEGLLESVVTSNPKFAPAYRTRGYARFNLNPTDPAVSMTDYEKSVALDPNYGEAHYAIAFMCAATGERDKGVDHYKKSMALGVADERNIGERFYADLLKPQ